MHACMQKADIDASYAHSDLISTQSLQCGLVLLGPGATYTTYCDAVWYGMALGWVNGCMGEWTSACGTNEPIDALM